MGNRRKGIAQGSGKAAGTASTNAIFARALALHRGGDRRAAETLYRRTLALDPGHADSLHLLGCVLLETGRPRDAIDSIREAVRVSPAVPLYRQNLTQALLRCGENAMAATEAEFALRLDPENARCWNLLGLALMESHRNEEALAAFSRSLAIEKKNPEAMVNLAAALNRTGDFAMALGWADLALRITPESPLAWTNRGMSLKGLGRYDEAREAFARAGDFPMARVNLGYMRLLDGDYAAGWDLYETRRQILGIGRGRLEREWTGERPAPEASLVIVPEQGMGDTILMSRFFPTLATMFASVHAIVETPLLRLMRSAFPMVAFSAASSTADAAPAADYWCPLMSLPRLLGIDRVDAIPREPYLRTTDTGQGGEPARAPRSAAAPLRAGINWAGNPSFVYDAIRSTSLATLAPLLDIAGVAWVSLHKGHREEEAAAYGLPQPLATARDFLDTAAILQTLDLVVSTETAIPNLSGAMGIPTIVLTTPDTDWRWHGWYPAVTACRRASPGAWDAAVREAARMVGGAVARVPRAAA